MFDNYEAEEKKVKLFKEFTIISYGPALKENELVPKVTFWSGNENEMNMSWGTVSHLGYLSRG